MALKLFQRFYLDQEINGFFLLHFTQPDISKANDKIQHDIRLLDGTFKSPTDNVSIKGCPSFSR